ncbi:MAG: hypothetical protein ABH840_01040 [Nanoarchaeota archaeon]
MNKKGFLLTAETVIKILIAVVCIGILIYLGYKIYDTLSSSDEEKKALSFIREFESKINAFKSSDLTEMTYMGFPPTAWYMKSFDVFTQGHPANQCVGRFTSCLCVCSKVDCSENLVACKGFKDSIVIDYTYRDKQKGSSGSIPPTTYGAIPSMPSTTDSDSYPGIIKFDVITELKVKKQDKLIKISKNE